MRVGIVGHEAAKFTPEGELAAKEAIRHILLTNPEPHLVSGGCHLGGIDIWAEEIADDLGIPKTIFKPRVLEWGAYGGFRDRNLRIAKTSDRVYCLVVDWLPPTYNGMKFDYCYHCNTSFHVKSGGCWTAHRAKEGLWVVIKQSVSNG